MGLAVAFGVAGCFTTAPQKARTVPAPEALPAPPVPLVPEAVPDAVPRVEPRSPYGNPPFYDVFGKRYFVLESSAGFVERGVASWYGPGFHEIQTSTHEPYDMYGMTAAHKTLPLPAYVRVTNLQNGRSVVVRVNDRGPFVGNRIIDLSYTAAAKLDMLRNGTAMVEVRAIDPGLATGARTSSTQIAAAPTPAAPNSAAPSAAAPNAAAPNPAAPNPAASRAALFVQAGAFANPANAERLAAKLRGGGYGKIFVRHDVMGGREWYRVRIGPVPDVPEFDRIVAALENEGVHDAHLALN
jgi:rare lipoprotein A